MTSESKEYGQPNAVVIGSGFGGLAAANRLASAGYQVKLFEQREKLGGRAYQLKSKGYTFDMGPSLITATDIIDSVFASAGKSMHDYIDLMPLDPFYRVYFHDGTHIDYSGDAEAMKRQMARFNERDAENYDRFMEAAKPVYDAVITDELGARPFDTIRSMVDFVPRAIKLNAWMPVSMFARRFFKDERHRFLFSFHPLFLGGNPFRAPSVYIMIPYLEREQGVWFARGGMYSLVEAFSRLFEEQGGQTFTSSGVDEIVVRDGKTVGVNVGGEFHEADVVVSNADVGYTYRKLIKHEHRRKWTDKRIDRLDQTMSCFLMYIGVRKQYPNLEHHTLILAERYKELLVDIFDRKILPDDFSMYLHVPTKSDPEMAPDGCESMYVLIPVANLRSGIDWSLEAPKFADKVLGFLEDWGLEGLRENLDVCELFTPDDFASELSAEYGNAFGIEPKLTQTAYLRPHNRSEDVENLYFVGAGTHPGAGVPGVLLSAETTAWCIEQDHGVGARNRSNLSVREKEVAS